MRNAGWTSPRQWRPRCSAGCRCRCRWSPWRFLRGQRVLAAGRSSARRLRRAARARGARAGRGASPGREPASAAPPRHPARSDGARARPLRGAAPDAREPGQGRAPDGGVRLRPARRLRRGARSRAGPPQAGGGRGRAGVHPPSPAGASLVGRPSLHRRGLPVLLGGHREPRGALALRPAARAARGGSASPVRGAGRDDRALLVGLAEPVLRACPRGGAAGLHLRPVALASPVPCPLRGPGASRSRGARAGPAELGLDPQPQGFALPEPRYRGADPPAVAQRHPEPGPALRVPPQPVLPPRRRLRPAASLRRRGGDDGNRHEADPGEDRRRRVGPPGARPRVRRLHLPQAKREADRPAGAAVEDHKGFARRPLPEPEREGSRLAHAASRRAFPARPVARHRPARDQPHPVPRLRRPGEQHRRRELAALPARAAGAVGGIRSGACQRPPRRGGDLPSAIPRPGSGGSRTAAPS